MCLYHCMVICMYMGAYMYIVMYMYMCTEVISFLQAKTFASCVKLQGPPRSISAVALAVPGAALPV